MTLCRDLPRGRCCQRSREHSLAFTWSGEVVEGYRDALPLNRHSILCTDRFFSLEEVHPKRTIFLALSLH